MSDKRDTARRIKQAVQRVERAPYNASPRASKYPIGAGGGGMVRDGIVTSTIGACSGTTPGTGMVQFYKPPSTGDPWVADGDPQLVHNWHTSTGIATGKHVTCGKTKYGYTVQSSDC